MSDEATIKSDLAKARQHEELLIFKQFDEHVAWQIGSKLHEIGVANNYPIIIDIRKGDDLLFFAALPGATPANADWARRKRNFVNLLQMSSYQLSRRTALGENMLDMMGLDPRDFTPHGGSFPVRVQGAGFVGTISVSGLPQKEDHKIVVDVLAEYLHVDLGEASF